MWASVLSKVTSVSQEASVLSSRSKEGSVSVFYSWGEFGCSCHGDEWPKYRHSSVAFLSGLPLSVPIQKEQVYQQWVRRPRQLISSSPLSDELAVEAAWLRGKVANSPKAFQWPCQSTCMCVCVCASFCLSLSLLGTSSLAMQAAHTLTRTHSGNTKATKQLWVQGTLNQAENTCKDLK